MTTRLARPPGSVSIAELYLHGCLTSADIHSGGVVDSTARLRAEREYANFMDRSTRPESAPAERLRAPQAVTPSRTAHAPPRARPAPPRAIVRAHTAHVRRVVTLQSVDTNETTLPKPLVLDKCVICYSRDREMACDPCFHFCVCRTCSQRLRSCPLCRVNANAFRKIYV